jgi:hypothetical protein
MITENSDLVGNPVGSGKGSKNEANISDGWVSEYGY